MCAGLSKPAGGNAFSDSLDLVPNVGTENDGMDGLGRVFPLLK